MILFNDPVPVPNPAERAIVQSDLPTAGHALHQALAQYRTMREGGKARVEVVALEVAHDTIQRLQKVCKLALTNEQMAWFGAILRGDRAPEGSKLAAEWLNIIERFAPRPPKYRADPIIEVDQEKEPAAYAEALALALKKRGRGPGKNNKVKPVKATETRTRPRAEYPLGASQDRMPRPPA